MCPSLAEPDSGDFPRSNVSRETLHDMKAKQKWAAISKPQANKKFFDAAVFQKCCRGVGEQPTFAKQMKLHNETATKI